jgi:hypothetical protein
VEVVDPRIREALPPARVTDVAEHGFDELHALVTSVGAGADGAPPDQLKK